MYYPMAHPHICLLEPNRKATTHLHWESCTKLCRLDYHSTPHGLERPQAEMRRCSPEQQEKPCAEYLPDYSGCHERWPPLHLGVLCAGRLRWGNDVVFIGHICMYGWAWYQVPCHLLDIIECIIHALCQGDVLFFDCVESLMYLATKPLALGISSTIERSGIPQG